METAASTNRIQEVGGAAMVRKVDISRMGEELRRFFQDLTAGEPYLLIEDQGRPVVGVVPPWQVGRLEGQREQLLTMLREVWARNQDVSPEEIGREVEEVVREVRQESPL
jgi:hypothetical protein